MLEPTEGTEEYIDFVAAVFRVDVSCKVTAAQEGEVAYWAGALAGSSYRSCRCCGIVEHRLAL